MDEILNFIDGRFVPAASRGWLDNVDPATGRVCGRLPDSDERDVEEAVRAAGRAFTGWSATPTEERSRILLRIADLLDEHLEELARAESIDTGKPLRLAQTLDIPRAVSNLRFFATAILHFHSESYATDGLAINYTLRQARGVAGLITPWNFPLHLLTWKVAPALATGNTAVATERLEQLRILENGFPIQVALTEQWSMGVDRPEDLDRVRERLRELKTEPSCN